MKSGYQGKDTKRVVLRMFILILKTKNTKLFGRYNHEKYKLNKLFLYNK